METWCAWLSRSKGTFANQCQTLKDLWVRSSLQGNIKDPSACIMHSKSSLVWLRLVLYGENKYNCQIKILLPHVENPELMNVQIFGLVSQIIRLFAMSQIMLIGPPLKVRFSTSADIIYTSGNQCSICTYWTSFYSVELKPPRLERDLNIFSVMRLSLDETRAGICKNLISFYYSTVMGNLITANNVVGNSFSSTTDLNLQVRPYYYSTTIFGKL